MNRTIGTMLMVALLGLWVMPVTAADDDLATLKERFKQRYPTLIKLKEAQKVGEIHDGFAGAVRAGYLDDKATDKLTVKQFLDAENSDRRKLYAIMAERTDTTVEEVATANAARLFEQGKDDWYFKPSGSNWKMKKDID